MGIKELEPKYTLEEFLEEEKEVDYPLEYVNGYIYAKSFISPKHNRLVSKISARLENYFEDKALVLYFQSR